MAINEYSYRRQRPLSTGQSQEGCLARAPSIWPGRTGSVGKKPGSGPAAEFGNLDMAMVKLDGPLSSDFFLLPFLNMVVFHINGSL